MVAVLFKVVVFKMMFLCDDGLGELLVPVFIVEELGVSIGDCGRSSSGIGLGTSDTGDTTGLGLFEIVVGAGADKSVFDDMLLIV